MQALAERDGDLLRISTGRVERTWQWNHGHLIGNSLTDLAADLTWQLHGEQPDQQIPGLVAEPADGRLEVEEVAETAVQPAHLQAIVSCRLGELHVKRVFRVYAGCPAIAGDLYMRGRADGPWRESAAATGDLGNVEQLQKLLRHQATAVQTETLALDWPHLRVRAVRFYDITDQRNTLVEEHEALSYRSPLHLTGNLLLATDSLTGDQLFILKEAACSDVQLAWPGADFGVQNGRVSVLGCGLDPQDLTPQGLDPAEWRRGYGCVVGVGGTAALRDYQHRRRRWLPGRDHLVLVNTWGDRSQDSALDHEFVRRELEAVQRLGGSHLQLDDGWQKGRSSNSAFSGGSLQQIWDQPDYWDVHPERFPHGLAPLVQYAQELDIELCLWFNPSADDSYAHWQDDAETLSRLYRDHGIRTFKIDGVYLPDHRADRNFRGMLQRVQDATNGDAVFNLDVTAGRRWGYHLGTEFGNIFVENRYTDWGNYYPHWTLRNLWQLSRYIPPQTLQMEFLNLWRNEGKYPATDPLRPANVPFEYAFAITMVAQPLAWFEAQNLPDQAFEAAAAVRTYREHQLAIHAGQIFPVGEEPCGTGWTGFQSIDGDHGYLLIFREWNETPSARVALHQVAGCRLALTGILGQATDGDLDVDDESRALFSLRTPFSYGLWRYAVEG